MSAWRSEGIGCDGVNSPAIVMPGCAASHGRRRAQPSRTRRLSFPVRIISFSGVSGMRGIFANLSAGWYRKGGGNSEIFLSRGVVLIPDGVVGYGLRLA